MAINFASAVTITNLDPTVVPGVPKIQLAGGIDYTATPNSTTVLVYNASTGYWVEDASQRYTAV
jgi:hypothetical protein